MSLVVPDQNRQDEYISTGFMLGILVLGGVKSPFEFMGIEADNYY
ncbi:unnamed protein product [Acidithrix sp. C25]|nr:unnamed protein product [Acidithrix sp. C25]